MVQLGTEMVKLLYFPPHITFNSYASVVMLRVFSSPGIRRVTQGFNSKNHCVARTYLYVIPTLAFCPVEKVTHFVSLFNPLGRSQMIVNMSESSAV